MLFLCFHYCLNAIKLRLRSFLIVRRHLPQNLRNVRGVQWVAVCGLATRGHQQTGRIGNITEKRLFKAEEAAFFVKK